MLRRRTLLISASVLAVVALGFSVLSYQWFVSPTEQEPGTADVIYVLGGGGDRVEYALELLRDGVSSTNTIVFSSEYLPRGRIWSAQPCNRRPTPDVPEQTRFECIEADPSTTRGEARLLAELVEDRGWESVVVVASTDQVTRARRLIDRCWDGDVRLTSVPHDQALPFRIAYEWGATIKATFLQGC